MDFALNKKACLEKWPKPWWPLVFFFNLSNIIIIFIETSHPNCTSSTPLIPYNNIIINKKEQLIRKIWRKKSRKRNAHVWNMWGVTLIVGTNNTNHDSGWFTFGFDFSYGGGFIDPLMITAKLWFGGGRNEIEKKEVSLNMLCYSLGREEREGKSLQV